MNRPGVDGYQFAVTGFDETAPTPNDADPGSDAAAAVASSDDDGDPTPAQEHRPAESADESAPELPS